jgi:serine/threonine-protein kinase
MMVTSSVRLARPLGEGGMGSVWVADHLALRTQVVVKFIATELKDSREAIDRFSREAAAAAQVKSPHVVQTHDHGVTADGVPYIVMELLEGRDLGAHLAESTKLAPELVLELLAQLSRALDKAHERGIVHRDIKPGNIFLCDAGSGEVFVKLLDFGIAKGVDSPQLDSHTKTGSMVGSPFYMSPEQVLGARDIDHRSDLWSMGVVAFEALTGARPFDAETMGGLAIKIHSEPLPLPSRLVPGLPVSVDAWFHTACARNVDERFKSARELAEAFAAALGGQMSRSMDVPRLSTGGGKGANAVADAHAPTLATTESGMVRPLGGSSSRGKWLGAAGVAVLGLVASFVVVKMLRGPQPGQGLVSEVTAARTGTAAPPSGPSGLSPVDPAPSSSVVILTAIPPGPASSATSATTLPVATPPPITGVRHLGARTKPGAAPPASASTTASNSAAPAPRPTSSGHDIF